jgi:DNA-binding MarR family transcriptional regulator
VTDVLPRPRLPIISLTILTIKSLSNIHIAMAMDDPVSACFAAHKSRITGDPIGQRLKEISILTREIGRKIGQTLGVNVTDMAALEQLLTNGPLTPGQLAARLDVTTAASTQIVDRLERAGHVTRERQADDRRKVSVVPAHAAVTRAFEALAPMLDGLDGAIAGLDSAERQVIERFLDQVIDVYRGVAGFSSSASGPPLE